MIQAQRLEEAPHAVVEVEAERRLRDEVDGVHQRILKRDHVVSVDRALHERRVSLTRREVQDVVDDEEQDDDPPPSHRA